MDLIPKFFYKNVTYDPLVSFWYSRQDGGVQFYVQYLVNLAWMTYTLGLFIILERMTFYFPSVSRGIFRSHFFPSICLFVSNFGDIQFFCKIELWDPSRPKVNQKYPGSIPEVNRKWTGSGLEVDRMWNVRAGCLPPAIF